MTVRPGLVVVEKPSGMTSHDVVARVRRLAGTRKVGHAGTLDPMATGVLLVCLGRATRVSEYLMASDKTYRAVYSRPGFERYEIQAVQPIRIIVKNGNITLDGVVATQLVKILAEVAVRIVPFAFSVTNNLSID